MTFKRGHQCLCQARFPTKADAERDSGVAALCPECGQWHSVGFVLMAMVAKTAPKRQNRKRKASA